MKKRILAAIFGGSAIGIIVLLLAFSFFKAGDTQVPGETPTPTPTPPMLVVWEDPAGFTMKYPNDITLDTNEDDDTVYAHVVLTHSDHPGSLTVWVKDPPKDTDGKPVLAFDAWVALSPEYVEALALDTTLGGKPAKKLVIPGNPKKIHTGTIFEDALFLLEATLEDEQYWQAVHDIVQRDFILVPLFTEEASQENFSWSSPVDAEEVLE